MHEIHFGIFNMLLLLFCRYIMSFPETKILRKQELDAFIVTALAPEFPNAQYTQELRVCTIL